MIASEIGAQENSVLQAMNARPGHVMLNLVHDLRQPLSSIEAIASYLEIRLRNENPEVRQYVARLQELVAEADTYLAAAVSATRSL